MTVKEQTTIIIKSFAFDRKWFHSAGLTRIDTRTDEEEKKAHPLSPVEGDLFLQINVITPNGSLQVVSLRDSNVGENGELVVDEKVTVFLYVELLAQLGYELNASAIESIFTSFGVSE